VRNVTLPGDRDSGAVTMTRWAHVTLLDEMRAFFTANNPPRSCTVRPLSSAPVAGPSARDIGELVLSTSWALVRAAESVADGHAEPVAAASLVAELSNGLRSALTSVEHCASIEWLAATLPVLQRLAAVTYHAAGNGSAAATGLEARWHATLAGVLGEMGLQTASASVVPIAVGSAPWAQRPLIAPLALVMMAHAVPAANASYLAPRGIVCPDVLAVQLCTEQVLRTTTQGNLKDLLNAIAIAARMGQAYVFDMD
jgi:hypothetical protein